MAEIEIRFAGLWRKGCDRGRAIRSSFWQAGVKDSLKDFDTSFILKIPKPKSLSGYSEVSWGIETVGGDSPRKPAMSGPVLRCISFRLRPRMPAVEVEALCDRICCLRGPI